MALLIPSSSEQESLDLRIESWEDLQQEPAYLWTPSYTRSNHGNGSFHFRTTDSDVMKKLETSLSKLPGAEIRSGKRGYTIFRPRKGKEQEYEQRMNEYYQKCNEWWDKSTTSERKQALLEEIVDPQNDRSIYGLVDEMEYTLVVTKKQD